MDEYQKIIIRNLRTVCSIGVYESEKLAPQALLIDAEVFLSRGFVDPKRDSLSEVLDYNQVRDTILSALTNAHVHLVETLVIRVAEQLLKIEGVQAVRVLVTKPQIFADCDGVGIEVLRTKKA
jgi:7,8-dihydroneopterin aldolase/epimerase/oxygenase